MTLGVKLKFSVKFSNSKQLWEVISDRQEVVGVYPTFREARESAKIRDELFKLYHKFYAEYKKGSKI